MRDLLNMCCPKKKSDHGPDAAADPAADAGRPARRSAGHGPCAVDSSERAAAQAARSGNARG